MVKCQYCARDVVPEEDGSCPYCGGNPGQDDQKSVDEAQQAADLDLILKQNRVAAETLWRTAVDPHPMRKLWLGLLGLTLGFGIVYFGYPAAKDLLNWLVHSLIGGV